MRRLGTHPLALWLGFVLVHLAVGALALRVPNGLGDVTFVYPTWVQEGLEQGRWVGLQTAWVYPILALPFMIAAYLIGTVVLGAALAGPAWLSLVFVADAVAFAFVLGIRRDPRRAIAGWWWLAFLLLLGPIALTRIDSFATAAALVGVLLLARSPRAAGAVLAIGAWIKVWPAALLVAAVIAVRRRLDVVLGALVVSAIVVAGVLALGGGANLFAFVTEQSGRGLEVEATLATPWMWIAAAHPGGDVQAYYDLRILAFQVTGPGVAATAALATPLLAATVLAGYVLALLAVRRGAGAAVLPPLALALTTALMIGNKVLSPQYVGWLAVPVVLALALRAPGRQAIALGGLVVAGLTQLIYPTFFDQLLALQAPMLAVLTVRNLLLVALYALAVAQLARLLAHRRRE